MQIAHEYLHIQIDYLIRKQHFLPSMLNNQYNILILYEPKGSDGQPKSNKVLLSKAERRGGR